MFSLNVLSKSQLSQSDFWTHSKNFQICSHLRQVNRFFFSQFISKLFCRSIRCYSILDSQFHTIFSLWHGIFINLSFENSLLFLWLWLLLLLHLFICVMLHLWLEKDISNTEHHRICKQKWQQPICQFLCVVPLYKYRCFYVKRMELK